MKIIYVKKHIVCLITLIGLACTTALLYTMRCKPSSASRSSFSIALFEPIAHPALEDIKKGFQHTLQQEGQAGYTFATFNAQGNPSLMRAQAEEILDGSFNLIFTIGAGCSQIIKELATKKGNTTPHVFAAVDDPVGKQLVASLENSGNQVTGVIELPHYEEQLKLLRALKPTVRTIVIPYDPTRSASLATDVQEIQQRALKHNIHVKAVEILSSHEIQQKLPILLSDTDVVMVLKDNTLVAAIQSVVKLCNQYHVTLYASDLNSSAQGAVLAYGVTEYDFGVHGARKAQTILEERKAPSSIASTPVTHYAFRINPQYLDAQNVILSPEQQLLFSCVELQ